MDGESLFAEAPDAANGHRARMLAEVQALIERRRRRADRLRARRFRPDFASESAYAASMQPLRARVARTLGWPLGRRGADRPPRVRSEPVGADRLGRIERVWIATLPGVESYGLLFVPPGPGPHPLVLSIHGGGGTPELCSGFFGSANYNDMTRRVLARGCLVFAPQLALWKAPDYGPEFDKAALDRRLKHLGGSLAALELYRLRRTLDALAARPDADPGRIGAIGLSYGGFYALYAAALDPRIRATVASGFVNERARYDNLDWVWTGSAERFLDTEVAALVCPRALCVEAGRRDALFAADGAERVAAQIGDLYRRLERADRFRFGLHEAAHDLDPGDGGIDFLCRHLGPAA